MPQIKFFEVRDRGTFMPVMATFFNGGESPLLRSAGYGAAQDYTILTKFDGVKSQYDPYEWPSNPRTMREAHLFIEKSNWGDLQDGQVIDVEFVLGETKVCKTSQL